MTALPNRAAFEKTVREAIDGLRGSGGARFALCFVDLDGFKLVNDSVGHHVGDALLVAVSWILRAALPPETMIARMGGDEFAIVLREAVMSYRVQAQRIVESLGTRFHYEAYDLSVRASVGVVELGELMLTYEDALRDADAAMYQAKKLGGGRFVIFDATMRARAKRRRELTNDLSESVARGQIGVAYQPIFDLNTQQVLGFEALARWEHPREGRIGPDEFIPIAESTGTIEALGRSVLAAACEQLARWRDTFELAESWTMNVNVAARQILNGSIVEDTRAILARSGLPAGRLTLEITESVLLDNVRVANETLLALRELGVRICIDDFGTGFSSLQYLQRFPIDGIKVDRSFVSGSGEGIASEPIVEMLITLSNVLELEVVVEGIETHTQMDRLQRLGCAMGQGFLLGKPMSPDEAIGLIQAGSGRSAVASSM